MVQHHALGLARAARGEQDEGGVGQQVAGAGRRVGDHGEGAGVEREARAGRCAGGGPRRPPAPPDGPAPRPRRRARRRAGRRGPRPVRDRQVDGAPPAARPPRPALRRSVARARGSRRCPRPRRPQPRRGRAARSGHPPAARRARRSRRLFGKRASRQASAALRPSRRAISMKRSLSGEPSPSINRSIVSASSSAPSTSRLEAAVDRALGAPDEVGVDRREVAGEGERGRFQLGGREHG